MADKKETQLDKAINRGKNSKYVMPIILTVVVVGGLASFLDDMCTIRGHFGFPCIEDDDQLSPDLKAVLDDRAETITDWLDAIIKDIEDSTFDYQQANKCFRDLANGIDASALTCEAVSKETFDLSASFRGVKDDFITLHNKYLEHLRNGNTMASHETVGKIHSLISATDTKLTAGLVGYGLSDSDDAIVYLNGFPEVVVDLRSENPHSVFDPYTQCIDKPSKAVC